MVYQLITCSASSVLFSISNQQKPVVRMQTNISLLTYLFITLNLTFVYPATDSEMGKGVGNRNFDCTSLLPQNSEKGRTGVQS